LAENEKKILEHISSDEAWKHVEYLSTFDKMSGTEGEKRAHEYVREKLLEYGVSFKSYEFDSLISHPGEASLRVTYPPSLEVECITHSFSGSTPPEGLEAELIHIPVSPGTLFEGIEGLLEEFEKFGVQNRIPLIWGIASPPLVWAAQRAGALAQVHICGGQARHEMIVTTIWGTPTPESAGRIPKMPVVSVNKFDGEKLLEIVRREPVKVRIKALTDTKWRRIPLTIAEINGYSEPEKFLLVHGHMDSWYVGTTDNCTGNAALLELARVFQANKQNLKRSIRLAWWSGHSTGRYSGSTWYADNLFGDLDKNCFLSMNIDSPGVKGATEIGGGGLAGTSEFIARAVRDATGIVEVESKPYYMRAGDQPFYGIGIPSIAVRAYIPDGSPLKGRWIGGSAGGWWWHSEYDTIDKADKENLHRDMKMEALAIIRSVNSSIFPFEFSKIADEYETILNEI
jgi:hypothetical protein